MKVRRWGNSLAVRLPASMVELLGLKEGDDIEIKIAGDRAARISSERECEQALARIEALARPLPPGFRFSRD